MESQHVLETLAVYTLTPKELGELPNNRLREYVNSMSIFINHLNLENEILETSLEKPALALRKSSMSLSYSRRTSSHSISTWGSFDTRPTLNYSTRYELLTRIYLKKLNRFESFKSRMRAQYTNLKAQITQFNIQKSEIDDILQVFEKHIAPVNLLEIEKTVPAEKFCLFMKILERRQCTLSERLRVLRMDARNLLIQKTNKIDEIKEFAPFIRNIDFDLMKLKNSNLKEELENKWKHKLELEKHIVKSNILERLAFQHLDNLVVAQKRIHKKIKYVKSKIPLLRSVEETVEKKYEVLNKTYSTIMRNVRDKPKLDANAYLRLKEELYHLNKTKTSKERKIHIQNLTIRNLKQNMKPLVKEASIQQYLMEDLNISGSFNLSKLINASV